MARRRRLEPPQAADLAAIRAAVGAPAVGAASAERIGPPPIAREVANAAEAQRSEIEALRAEARRHRADADRLAAAAAAGLVIREVPLRAIDVDYLARDRLPRAEDDAALQALRASIEQHGQRTPLELADLGDAADPRYGLVSGYRRYCALQRLASETGAARWRTARAIVRTPGTLGAAFIAMVEENEIREGLSYFERGQVCLRAVEQGAFGAVDAAIDALFAGASPAKRSKIRSFVLICETIGDVLRRPEALGERLGLRLAQAIRADHGGALRRFLGERPGSSRDAAEEQAALTAFLKQLRARPAPAQGRAHPLAGGGTIVLRRRAGRIVVEIEGAGVDATAEDALLAAIAGFIAAPGG